MRQIQSQNRTLTPQSWYEKYRPTRIEEMIFPSSEIKSMVQQFYRDEAIDGNMLLYGPAGTGKTSLANVLGQKITKGVHFIPVNSGIENIKELRKQVQYAPGNKQNIVLIEEIDKLSMAAQTMLKDGLMEKHQAITAFIATTNYPEKLDKALASRFNIKVDFSRLPVDEVYEKLVQILQAEEVSFNPYELKRYVEDHSAIGLRDLINDLQMHSSDKSFSYSPDATIEREDVAHHMSTGIDLLKLERGLLKKKYNKSVLSMQEVSNELGIDKKTLKRKLDEGQALPPFIRQGRGAIFPLIGLADYLTRWTSQ